MPPINKNKLLDPKFDISFNVLLNDNKNALIEKEIREDSRNN